jgi:myo-inositol-1(or 4)-monophosphatase
VGPVAGTEAGRAEHAVGAGGDRTVELDRLAEEAAIAVLQRVADSGARFSLLSEEVGRKSFGADLPLVLLDPIDGSLNAKQGLPVFAAMAALARGQDVGSVEVGYVANLVSGDRFHAVTGEGAFRNSSPITALKHAGGGRLEVLGLESTSHAVYAARPLIEMAGKLRILGSMAISIVHVATGGFDAFCAPVDARVFDMTASLLILAEAGGIATDARGRPLGTLPADLESRSTLVATADRRVHEAAIGALS